MPLLLDDPFIRRSLGARLVHVRAGVGLAPATSVVVDSREVRPGSLFVALPGERVDGHAFAAEAAGRGAVAILAARPIEAGPATVYQVDDSLAALQDLAAAWRDQFAVTVVGVTGSVGKTTTKELTAAVLARGFRILKSERNLNSEIGLPLTLFGLDGSQELAVFEMGMYAVGEIALLCRLARPTYGIVTNIGPVHLERLGTIERIAEAKSELPAALPAAGSAYLNADDPRVAALAGRTAARVRTYGFGPGAAIRASAIEARGLDGTDFLVSIDGIARRLRTRLAGRHLVASALPAIGLGRDLGLDWDAIEAGLNDPVAELRLRIVNGPRGSRILDDTYNASPASVRGALDLLGDLPGRRIAVLGDMRELGAAEQAAHQEIGAHVAGRADWLIVVGNLASTVAEAARAAGVNRVDACPTKAAVVDLLAAELGPDDRVLVKGSRGLELETIVAALAEA